MHLQVIVAKVASQELHVHLDQVVRVLVAHVLVALVLVVHVQVDLAEIVQPAPALADLAEIVQLAPALVGPVLPVAVSQVPEQVVLALVVLVVVRVAVVVQVQQADAVKRLVHSVKVAESQPRIESPSALNVKSSTT